MLPVSAGGSTLNTARLPGVSPATVFALRLIVRRHGQTVNAAMLDPNRIVSASPRFSFTAEESGDGHYLFVIPRGLLRPGTTYRLRIAGAYTDNGVHMGNFNPAGPPTGRFRQTITVTTTGSGGALPLQVHRNRASAITIRRLAVPEPAFLPSVNQIGFDSYDWIASTIARSRSRVLLWVIGAFKDAHGVERVDPHSAFSFPVSGPYAGHSLALSSPGVSLVFSFGLVPLRRFELRGYLQSDLSFRPGVSLFADTVCATVPVYGPELPATGICNPSGVLATSGTLLASAYTGSASVRPAGVRVRSLRLMRSTRLSMGAAVARFAGPGLPSAAQHVAAVLLTDAASGQPVDLDYHAATHLLTHHGRIVGVHLRIPRDQTLPGRVRAYVMIDAFPVTARVL